MGPAAAAAPSGSVTVGGAELRWVREGQGRPIFILGTSIYYPKAFSNQLRNHFELVFIDGRHFVPTYAPDAETLSGIDLATFADDVEAVRLALGYDEIAVVGHSVHGQIALEYADRYPLSTSTVILVAAVPYAFAEFEKAREEVWDNLASEERKTLLESRLENLSELLEGASSSRSFAVSYNQNGPLYWANPDFDATALLAGLENGLAFDRLAGTMPSRQSVFGCLHALAYNLGNFLRTLALLDEEGKSLCRLPNQGRIRLRPPYLLRYR